MVFQIQLLHCISNTYVTLYLKCRCYNVSQIHMLHCISYRCYTVSPIQRWWYIALQMQRSWYSVPQTQWDTDSLIQLSLIQCKLIFIVATELTKKFSHFSLTLRKTGISLTFPARMWLPRIVQLHCKHVIMCQNQLAGASIRPILVRFRHIIKCLYHPYQRYTRTPIYTDTMYFAEWIP